MIKNTFTKKHLPALTSSRWHVVLARFSKGYKVNPFTRSIASEHDDRKSAVRAARALSIFLRREGTQRPLKERDQIFVRRPNFKSLQRAGRVTKG